MSNEPTPRTDAQINGRPCTQFAIMAGDSLRDALVKSEFARQLERELNAMTQQRDEARECLERCARAHCELGASLRSRIVYFENQRDSLAEALRVATAYPLSESWYKQAMEALATLKPCD
jgi:hypothetical protein